MAAMGLTGLKQQLVGAPQNNLPVTPSGLVGNRTLSRYATSGFTPSTHGSGYMTGTSQRVYTYETLDANLGVRVGGYVDSTNNIYWRPRSNGVFSAGMSSSITDGPAKASSVGGSSVSRSGGTLTFRTSGVDQGTASPSAGSTLGTAQLYLLVDNASGPEAGSYTSTNLVVTILSGAMTQAQDVAQHTNVVALLSALNTILGSLTIYVSSVNYGGIPVGSDTTGAGTAAAPLLTWDTGYAFTRSGDTLTTNGQTGSPTTYLSSTALTLGKAITVQPVNSLGTAIASGTGTGQAVLVNPTDGSTVSLVNQIVDASLNTAGTALTCVALSSVATAFHFTATGCSFLGWSSHTLVSYAIAAQTSSFRGYVTLTNCTFASDDVRGAFLTRTIIEGGLTVSGGSATLTKINSSGVATIHYDAAASGTAVSISNFTATLTIDPSVTGAALYYGVYVAGVLGATIDGCTVHMTGNGSGQEGLAIAVGVNDTTRAPCSGSTISNCVVTVDAIGGGALYTLGSDGSSDLTLCVDMLIHDCTGTGTAQGQVAALHGIEMGTTTNGICRNCTVTTAAIGLVDKLASGNLWDTNTITDCTSTYMLAKGTVNSIFRGNTINMTNTTGTGFYAEDDNGGDHSTGIQVTGNAFVVNGQTGAILVRVDANCTATFSNNTYNVTSGSINAHPFIYQGVSYTPAQWLASFEPTATGNIF